MNLLRFVLPVVCLVGASSSHAAEAKVGTRTDQEMKTEYTKLWRSALAESSGIPESALAPLVHVDGTEIQTWNSGKTFRVRYTLRLDWLTIQREDNFTVWINESESGYRHLGLPRDTWLTGPDLKTVIARKVFDSALGRVDPTIKLAFSSQAEAERLVCTDHKLASLDQSEVTFYVPGKVPHEDGLPYLVWSAVLDEKANRALNGYLNLVTKERKSWQNAIRMNATPSGGGISPEG